MEFLKLFEKPCLIAAHRGDRSHCPENTMRALVSSVGRCDFIEIDVQLSRDGVPVIVHDESLKRTTDAAALFPERLPWNTADFRLDELKALDFGSWFDGVYEPLLTLEMALNFATANNQFLNIEIKDLSAAFADESVVESVVEVIQRLDAASRVLISSFYHPYLAIVKELVPTILTALLLEESLPALAYLKQFGALCCHLDDAITDEMTVSNLKSAGFYVNVYTVNEPAREQELFAWGVNGVFTDNLWSRQSL